MPKLTAKSRVASENATESSTEQLNAFIAKFDAANAKLIRSSRAALRKRLPAANELVYDNYNFLAIGFCSTERASDCIVSLAAGSNGVSLSFYYGATLPDPDGILLGSGNQNRFVRLESAGTLKQPAVETLLRAAIAQAKAPLPKRGKGRLIIKSISAKQRPRRVASAISDARTISASNRAGQRPRPRR